MGVTRLLDFPRFAVLRLLKAADLAFIALREDCCSISISSSRLSSLGRAANTSGSMSCNIHVPLEDLIIGRMHCESVDHVTHELCIVFMAAYRQACNLETTCLIAKIGSSLQLTSMSTATSLQEACTWCDRLWNPDELPSCFPSPMLCCLLSPGILMSASSQPSAF